MIQQMHIPGPPLGHFIRFFIYYEGVPADHKVDRFLPNGDTEILIDFHDAPQYIYDNDTLKEIQSCHHVWASGVRTEPITIPSGNDSAMMVIMFRKGAAAPFFPFPMDEISDCVFDADLVWGPGFRELREMLLAEQDIRRRFAVVEAFLLDRFRNGLAENACVDFAIEQMSHRPDAVRISRMNQKIGYSQKHFTEMFRRRVGVTPKAYLKIMRFQHAIKRIAETAEVDWAAMAAECGFFDQSHFINDFKHFSGFTPEQYSRIQTDYQNYVPVG